MPAQFSHKEREEVAAILDHVEQLTGVTPEEVKRGGRQKRIVEARYLSAAAIRCRFNLWTLQEICDAIGTGDHSTAVHWIKRAKEIDAKGGPFSRNLRAIIEHRTQQQPKKITTKEAITKLKLIMQEAEYLLEQIED